VLITQNVVIYGILALVSLIFAFALIQQNYKFAAALLPLVSSLSSFINPNAFE
jgi:hypothetical protein